MGLYINPKNVTKEEWLEDNGIEISEADFSAFEFRSSEFLPVVHVNDGGFTAAIVVTDKAEHARVSAPDPRPKRHYIVPKTRLKEFTDA